MLRTEERRAGRARDLAEELEAAVLRNEHGLRNDAFQALDQPDNLSSPSIAGGAHGKRRWTQAEIRASTEPHDSLPLGNARIIHLIRAQIENRARNERRVRDPQRPEIGQ